MSIICILHVITKSFVANKTKLIDTVTCFVHTRTQSYASFNRERYFSKLPSGTVTAPTLFPIVDLFETDADLDSSEEAFEVLTQVRHGCGRDMCKASHVCLEWR